jgi:hypothetical protein
MPRSRGEKEPRSEMGGGAREKRGNGEIKTRKIKKTF